MVISNSVSNYTYFFSIYHLKQQNPGHVFEFHQLPFGLNLLRLGVMMPGASNQLASQTASLMFLSNMQADIGKHTSFTVLTQILKNLRESLCL